ncbi:MAG TPA: DUF6199 family natural product biosynthesis protein [Tissierellaceae bacterium]|nr:DUF6199 family natural product biosynthesis protein [Tissierellaceae bacterium]
MRLYEVFLYSFPLIVLGLVMLLKPQLLWKIENFLTTKGGEPSDFYLSMMVLGGTLTLLFGMGLLIFGVLKFVL